MFLPSGIEAAKMSGGGGLLGGRGDVSVEPTQTPAQQVPMPGRQVLLHDEMIAKLYKWLHLLVDVESNYSPQTVCASDSNISGKWPKLLGPRPVYDASQESEKFIHVESFIRDLEFAMSGSAWTDLKKVESGMFSLRGEVLRYMKTLEYSERNTRAKFKSVLRKQFSLSASRLARLEAALKLRRTEKEKPRSFLYRVRNAMNELDPYNIMQNK